MLKSADLEKIKTEDGSWTLRNKKTKIFYRSKYGAKEESEHVFFHASKISGKPSPWHVLELGFGTGCNFATTAQHALKNNLNLHYETIDYAPIPSELIDHSTPCSGLIKKALNIARTTGTKADLKKDGVRLVLHPYSWKNCTLKQEHFDAVYHDPFAVSDNPECWTEECFSWSFSALKPDGILTTYSAAGKIRRAMAAAGFFVAIAKGSGSKREMTVAARAPENLDGLKIKYRPLT